MGPPLSRLRFALKEDGTTVTKRIYFRMNGQDRMRIKMQGMNKCGFSGGETV